MFAGITGNILKVDFAKANSSNFFAIDASDILAYKPLF